MNSKVNQKNNNVSGDLAGRDINKNSYFYNGEISALRKRSEELKKLYAEDDEYRGFIDKLQKYMSPSNSQSKIRDLSTKLKDGDREDLIDDALKLKEAFAKKMSRHQFSEQAQELFVHILANINTFFKSKIVPMIKNGDSNKDIDAILYDELIVKIYNDIGTSQLDIDTEEIRGMIFYLTGNCHLEWDK